MALVENRYVRALADSAKSKEENTMFEKGLKEISNLFVSDKNFKNILLNPLIENHEKLEVIKGLFPAYQNETLIHFLELLLEENRINIIDEIALAYTKLYEIQNHEISMKIITAMELDQKQIDEIVQKYKDLYQVDTVNYEVIMDKKIIGGVKVIVGNKVYDNSVKRQIEDML